MYLSLFSRPGYTLLLALCLFLSPQLHAQTTSNIGAGYFNGAVFARFTTPATTGSGSATRGPVSGNLNGNNFTITFTDTAGLYNTYTSGTGTPAPGVAIYPNYAPGGMPSGNGWPASNIPTVDLVWRTGLPGSGTARFTRNLNLFDQVHVIDIDTREGVQFEFLDSANTPLNIAANVRVVRLSSMGSGASANLSNPTATAVGINLDGAITGNEADEGYAFVMLTNNVRSVRFTQTLNSLSSTTNSWNLTFSTGSPDRGDAPVSYGDAAHLSLANLLRLGTNGGDADTVAITAVAPAAATGDDGSGTDDEDAATPGAVSTTTSTTQTVTYSFNAAITNNSGSAANVVAWIDWNTNGIFEAGEGRAVTAVPTGSTSLSRTFSWTGVTLSGNAGTGATYMRIRTSSVALTTSDPSGYLDGIGEVEDYRISFSNTMSVTITGNVYTDNNGMTGGVGGTAYNGATVTLYAADGTTVLATTTTNASGAYSFTVTTTGNLVVAVTAPAGYAHVSATDAMPADGRTTVAISNANVSGISFGIDRTPDSDTKTRTLPSTPIAGSDILLDGTDAPLMSGSDPEDGTYTGSTGTIANPLGVVITSLPTHGELWYYGFGVPMVIDTTDITNGTIFEDPSMFSIVFTGSGYTSTTFRYAYVDAAGAKDPTPASYTLDWGTALPIVLLQFTVYANSGAGQLAWTTAREQGSKGFDIEHSTDGSRWTKIGFVSSRSEEGNSNIDYSFTDHNAVNGNNYYRLKQLDWSGSFTYSAVAALSLSKAYRVAVYPNPVANVLTIDGLESNARISITNAMGQGISSRVVAAAESQLRLDMTTLPNGVYHVTVTAESGTIMIRQTIIKQ